MKLKIVYEHGCVVYMEVNHISLNEKRISFPNMHSCNNQDLEEISYIQLDDEIIYETRGET